MTLGQALVGMMFLINMELAWWEAAVLFVAVRDRPGDSGIGEGRDDRIFRLGGSGTGTDGTSPAKGRRFGLLHRNLENACAVSDCG